MIELLTAIEVLAILRRQISNMESKLNSPIRYRGTVATADLLPLNPDIGDMYNIESKSVYGEAGMNVAWNGVVWDTMGAPIDMSLYLTKEEGNKTFQPKGNYLSGTDSDLKESGKAADAKATGEKIAKNSSDITKKLDKNQGVENSGKIAGINESGDIVPMFPVGVEYNSETNCLEFGTDQKMKLNQGIGIDSSLTKTGYAADAGTVGEVTNSLKEDLWDIQTDKSSGDNLYNKTKNINGVYINSSGVTVESETLFCTEMISIIPNQNYCFSMVTGLGGYFCISQYDNDRKFIKNDNIKPEAFTIATDAKRKYIIKQYDCAYIVVSSVIANYADNLMIAKGSDYIYKDYLWYWNDDTRKQVMEVKEFLDNQKVVDLKEYTLPYIKNGKLCCNGSGKTAYYAGIDCGSKINAMWCNFIFEEEKENLGNATLIINPNGVDSISNITDISLHCQIFPDRVKMDILGAKFGQDKHYYKTLLEFNFDTPLVCDGITEHTAILSVSESSNNVYLTIDGTQYSSHFTPDDNISSISDVIGQYVIIEHFCTTERAKTTMPMFTYLQARDINNIYKLRDYFDRQNGVLQNAPTGQAYHLLNNEKYKR